MDRTTSLFGVKTPGQGDDRSTEPALKRAAAAQIKMLEDRSAAHAEQELRDLAIIEAYENGLPVRKIARAVGISPTTVNGIIASR